MTIRASEVLRHWIEASHHYSQSELASQLNVSRTAVNKWCKGRTPPSAANAELIERISGGAVPAHIWRRRRPTVPLSPGAQRLQDIAATRKASIFRLAQDVGIPPRALARWATSEHAPRRDGIELLNEVFGLDLTREDFEVRA